MASALHRGDASQVLKRRRPKGVMHRFKRRCSVPSSVPSSFCRTCRCSKDLASRISVPCCVSAGALRSAKLPLAHKSTSRCSCSRYHKRPPSADKAQPPFSTRGARPSGIVSNKWASRPRVEMSSRNSVSGLSMVIWQVVGTVLRIKRSVEGNMTPFSCKTSLMRRERSNVSSCDSTASSTNVMYRNSAVAASRVQMPNSDRPSDRTCSLILMQ